MEQLKCQKISCRNDPLEVCQCGALVCEEHTHRNLPGHRASPIYTEITDIQKAATYIRLLASLEQCRDKRQKLLRNSQSMISCILAETNMILERLKCIESEILQILNVLGKASAISTVKCTPSETSLLDFIQNSKPFNISDISTLPNSLLNSETLEMIDNNPLQSESQYIACYKKSSKELQVLDVVSLQIKTSTGNSIMGDRAGWCLLPDGRIFHYGGWIGNNNTQLCVIINPTNRKIERVKDNKCVRNIGQCSYYKGNVYVFGGHNENTIPDSYRYNLLKDEWARIAPMPSKSRDTYSVTFGTRIVIGGQKHDSLYNYSPNADSYQESLHLTAEKMKIVWTGFGKVYVLSQNKIFESGLFDLNQWGCIRENVDIDDNRLMGHSVRCSMWVYFLFEDHNLYRFNLQDKSIEQVAKKINI